MRIAYTVPGISRHGGIRVIFEHINRLCDFGHEVYALCAKRQKPDWFDIDPRVHWEWNPNNVKGMDVLVITSPHAIEMAPLLRAKKTFVFCQMAEHLFKPHDKQWFRKCKQFYTAPYPMLSISEWNAELFEKGFGRTGETHMIGNGVNLKDFPIQTPHKDGKTVLVEGWENGNPTKDVDHLGPKVAKRLKADGYHILAYSALPLKTMPDAVDEYFEKPTLEELNDLYRSASILIKATKCDARACAPMEAMTKGTVTVRAIERGDDDLYSANSVRCSYDEKELYDSAKMLLEEDDWREGLAAACVRHVQENSWEYWMPIINKILTA